MSALEHLAGRRILFLNWRDMTNPAAGGAEAYAEQIAQRFARAGALVTVLTSEHENAPPFDCANGYMIIRRGGRFGVYPAVARLLHQYRNHYDAVVDFQNGIPFFSPLWAPPFTAIICVIHHVHQAQFSMYFPWPLSSVGRLLEGRVSRRVYRDVPFVAVSPSTRAEMRKQLGFRGAIHLVPNGIDPLPPSRVPRSPTPAIAVVTRLVPHKRLHLLVEAVPDLLRRWPELRVDIAGTGPARDALLAQVGRLGLQQSVKLPGYVSEQEKSDLLSRSWLTVAPSLAEGWGLTVLEANTAGTPALAYDVPGLRDSVRDGITGWLVPANQELATGVAGALEELSDPRRQDRVSNQARWWARQFSWDASSERLASLLLSEIMRRQQGSPSRRRAIDLATIAYFPPDDTGELERLLRKALRATDVIVSGRDGIRVILMGCDELGAAKALERVPVPPAGLRLATTTQALCGTGEDIAW